MQPAIPILAPRHIYFSTSDYTNQYSTVRGNLRGLHKAAAIWSPHTEYQLWKCYPFLCTIPYHQIGNNTFWAELVPTYWVPFTPHASTLCMPEQPMNHSSMRKGVTHMVITAWLQCWWLATQLEQTSLESTRNMARECPPCIYIWFAFIGQRMLQGWLFVVGTWCQSLSTRKCKWSWQTVY